MPFALKSLGPSGRMTRIAGPNRLTWVTYTIWRLRQENVDALVLCG